MKKVAIFFFLFFFFMANHANAFSVRLCCNTTSSFAPGDSLKKDSLNQFVCVDSTGNEVFSGTEKKRFVAALLAFPIPFGWLGLHRIYLGTDPWVPVIYIVSIGGGFGLVPLIDFFEIIFSSDEEFKSFEKNKNIFMWVN